MSPRSGQRERQHAENEAPLKPTASALCRASARYFPATVPSAQRLHDPVSAPFRVPSPPPRTNHLRGHLCGVARSHRPPQLTPGSIWHGRRVISRLLRNPTPTPTCGRLAGSVVRGVASQTPHTSDPAHILLGPSIPALSPSALQQRRDPGSLPPVEHNVRLRAAHGRLHGDVVEHKGAQLFTICDRHRHHEVVAAR